jgi:hypothetical protein
MAVEPTLSEFRVEKQRAAAVLTLSSGESMHGCFFVGGGSARHAGPERVSDVLNAETGFFPFEVHDADGARTLLFNRNHVVMVALAEDEARRDPGYSLATRRVVSVILSSGRLVRGAVRVYRPEGHNRLSDWARHSEMFRYVEAPDTTLIVNTAHIIAINEVFDR